MPSYTAGFKSRMVQRMAGAEGISAYALSTEVGVSQANLSRWLRDAPTVGVMSKNRKEPGGRSPRRTAGDKFRIVLEASALSGDELGAFMRKEGIHSTQLEQWRSAAQAAAEGALKSTHAKASERTPEARRIKELERDLHRKNKALAEATALLALKFGFESMHRRALWILLCCCFCFVTATATADDVKQDDVKQDKQVVPSKQGLTQLKKQRREIYRQIAINPHRPEESGTS